MNSTYHTKRTPLYLSLIHWLDSHSIKSSEVSRDAESVDWLRCIPFLILHLGCLGILWVGWSPVALLVAGSLYLIRMFAVTGFYHRYFSHRTFSTSRWAQFLFALLGSSAVQRGPLWWAAHHRHHHRYSDLELDVHSPHRRSFLWSHMGWFMSRKNFPTREEKVRDLLRFPELVFLDRFDTLIPALLALSLLGLGALLAWLAPSLGTSGPQMLVWGFCVSTIVLFHATATINSLAHKLGTRPYATRDESRNNFLLALLTLGEGWHNNHHHFPGTVRQGFFWWQVDITYYVLYALSRLGLIWDLRPVPRHVREGGGG